MAFATSVPINRHFRTHIQRFIVPSGFYSKNGQYFAVAAPPKRPRSRTHLTPPRTHKIPIPLIAPLHESPPCYRKDRDGREMENTRLEGLRDTLQELIKARGALGRGMKACLRALHVRGKFTYDAAVAQSEEQEMLYVEFSPAYAIAVSLGRVTRYAVEQKAWPELRRVMGWEEIEKSEARKRGATLRILSKFGRRYGRHLFIGKKELGVALEVALEVLQESDIEAREKVGVVEAIIPLTKLPQPGIRTVAAKCPRSMEHSHFDRKPSLMLWMNSDGVTGGAMCPVCVNSASVDRQPKSLGVSGCPPRNMTWRVSYEKNNRAILFTPQNRREDYILFRSKAETRINPKEKARTNELSDTKCSRQSNSTQSKQAGPVGGCVMRNKRELGLVGGSVRSAYVTAALKSVTEFDKDTLNDEGHVAISSTRVRTIGNVSKHTCPLRILLSADRRSLWSNEQKKIENLSWFARQSVDLESRDECVGEDSGFDVTDWQPTSVLSISAMRASAWRTILGVGGKPVHAPAAWEPVQQQWIVVDLDDIQLPDDEGVKNIGKSFIRVIRRCKELSGRCAVVQTGPEGLHIWTELREVRERPREWFGKDETRLWYAGLGKGLLMAARRCGASNGKVDMSSCSAGRFARRPGWRILEDGSSFRSKIVTIAASRVKGRTKTPRYSRPGVETLVKQVTT